MNVFPYLLSISLFAADPGDKVGVTGVIANDQTRNFGIGHAGANAAYIQQLRTATLPVTLVNFDAKTTNRAIKLAWKTASEQNSAYFILKRAGVDNVFTELAQLKAAGQSSHILHYQYIDRSPLFGDNYYQLEQVDTDGKRTLSKIIVANHNFEDANVNAYFAKDGSLSTVFNTPTQQKLVTITIHDANGRTVATKNVNSTETNHYQFHDLSLKEGLYIVSFALKDQTINLKVIK